MNILFIGDIVGKPGRMAVEKKLAEVQRAYDIDFTIANGENLTNGKGIAKKNYLEMMDIGIDVLTGGNHIWDKKEIFHYIDGPDIKIVRPYNYPAGTPGSGYQVFGLRSGVKIAVVNLLGRVYMPPIDCPFLAMDRILSELQNKADIIFVDFHAEATSEKQAMGWYLDGKVQAVVGTHTHVQTADAKILPKKTAYISDAGMTGPLESVLGVDKDLIVEKFRTQMPVRFEIAKGEAQFNGVVIELDGQYQGSKIKNIQEIVASF